jgi:Fe-S oxidoreductase
MHDPDALQAESLRVFEICNGCRRCFNLCPSFDVLFREIDERDGETAALDRPVHDRIADLCYYCKLCFNHCPYCPPHDYGLDFPRLMLWGKHLKAKRQPPSRRDRWLADADRMGRLGGFAAPLLNWAADQPWARWILEKGFGIHRNRILPKFHKQSFGSWFKQRAAVAVGQAQPSGKVALFYTCYVNRHDPGIGKAAIHVLERNGIEAICPEQECCGMPYLDFGDLETVKDKAERNLKSLSAAVEAGYDIVAPMPTCSLMLKKEYPDLFGTDQARRVAAHTYDLCEYLMKLHAQGRLSTEFTRPGGKIAYQVPCHLRDQNIGLKSRDLMRLIPGTTVEAIERCSGHDGTFGLKEEYYELSMEVGRKAFAAARRAEPDLVVSDCPLSAGQMAQATGLRPLHPIQVVARAYGINP